MNTVLHSRWESHCRPLLFYSMTGTNCSISLLCHCRKYRSFINTCTLECYLLTNLIVFSYVKVHQKQFSPSMFALEEDHPRQKVFHQYIYIWLSDPIYWIKENLQFCIIWYSFRLSKLFCVYEYKLYGMKWVFWHTLQFWNL